MLRFLAAARTLTIDRSNSVQELIILTPKLSRCRHVFALPAELKSLALTMPVMSIPAAIVTVECHEVISDFDLEVNLVQTHCKRMEGKVAHTILSYGPVAKSTS